MHQNVSHLGSTAGTLFLICYVIAGLITAAAGFLPGNASRLRLVCVTFGLALAGWSAKVLFTGGPMLIGLAVLLAPLSLTVTAIIGTCRAYSRRRAPTRLSRPHPAAARTYTEPNSPFPPVVPVPVHAPWPSTHLAPADPFLPSSAARSSSPGAHLFPVGAHSAPVAGSDLSSAVVTPNDPAPAHRASTVAHRAGTEAPETPMPAPAAGRGSAHGAPSVHAAVQAGAGSTATPAAPAGQRRGPRRLSTPAAQPRFHGHAIAPPPAFPTPPRFAPQPLHNVPAPQPHSVPAPRAHNVPVPQPHNVPAPRPHSVPAPQPHSVLVPRTHNVPAPQPHNVPAPRPHSVPAPRPALDDHITARFQASANHLQPSPSHSSRSSLAPSPEPFASQHPSSAQVWARAHAWTGEQPAVHDWTDSSPSRQSSRRLRGVVPSQNPDRMTPSPTVEPSMRMALAPVTDPSPLQPSSVRARHRAGGTSA
ncbi:hypothetical protein GCM10009827_051670 [Dactylosporangium maewongense]|uniref:Uncharacterized protein n=1 Tax=Dactylosporangium maewongense TaxID=634393 RepID=A0ABP4LNI5_9ACTN